MQTKIVACMVALSILVGVAFGQGMFDRDQDVRDQIQETYNRYSHAILRKDVDAAMDCLTPDVVWIEKKDHPEGREIVRKEIVAMIHQIKPGYRLWFKVEKLKVDGENSLEAYVSSHFSGPDGKDRAPAKPKTVWHDTWVKEGGWWKNKLGVVESWSS